MQSINVSGYINAGGRGTRLNGIFTPDPQLGVSKALLKVGDPPITLIEHHINKLLTAGLRKIVIGVGDHDHVADFISYRYRKYPGVIPIVTRQQLGNGGDLVRAVRDNPYAFAEHVVIVNVDSIVDFDEAALAALHVATGGNATIALTQKKGVPNEDAFYLLGNEVIYNQETTANQMSQVFAATQATWRGSSTGIVIFRTAFLNAFPWEESDGSLGIYREVLARALQQGRFYAYDNGLNFFIDVGTEETWNYVQQHPERYQRLLHYLM